MFFRLIDTEGFDMLRGWFSDSELRRRIDYPSEEWYRYVSEVPGNYAWLILEDGETVGHVQLDTQSNHTGSVGLIVRPDLRGRGIGKRILRTLRDQPEIKPLQRMEAWVDSDNVASLKCFLVSGFFPRCDVPDENGLVVLVWERSGDGGKTLCPQGEGHSED